MLEAGGLALLDDQRPDQAFAELFGAVHMRVIPEAASIRDAELVIEILARQHRQLRDVRHTVHLQRQADAMPVNGGGYRQVVDETHTQPLTLTHPQLGARRGGAESPGLGLVAGNQFDIQRRGNQLVVMPGVRVAAPQPVTGCATGAQTDCHQAGQATEYLSPGKGHAAGTS
ncbi:hypothetical protein D3C77_291180 [compost metagenome]